MRSFYFILINHDRYVLGFLRFMGLQTKRNASENYETLSPERTRSRKSSIWTNISLPDHNTIQKNGLSFNAVRSNNNNNNNDNENHRNNRRSLSFNLSPYNASSIHGLTTGINRADARLFGSIVLPKENHQASQNYTNRSNLVQRDELADRLEALLTEVQAISLFLAEQNHMDEIERNWLELREVLDRFFFLLFLGMYLVSTIVLLLPVCLVHL